MKYFEITFTNYMPNFGEYDICEDGGSGYDYSICIKATRKPTREEAENFCKKDMENMGYKFICDVREISPKEAFEFFDMDNEDTFPIFS